MSTCRSDAFVVHSDGNRVAVIFALERFLNTCQYPITSCFTPSPHLIPCAHELNGHKARHGFDECPCRETSFSSARPAFLSYSFLYFLIGGTGLKERLRYLLPNCS